MASPCSPHLSIFIVKCNKTLCVPSHSPLHSLPKAAPAPHSPISLGSGIASRKPAVAALVLLVSSYGYTGQPPPPGMLPCCSGRYLWVCYFLS